MSLLVETNNHPDEFKEDEWVVVEGVINLETFDGLDTPHINADCIIPVGPPKDRYLYPNFH